MMRAIVSVDPPGASGTSIVTGREGKDCAFAPPIAQAAASAMATIVFIISFPPRRWVHSSTSNSPGPRPSASARPGILPRQSAGNWCDHARPRRARRAAIPRPRRAAPRSIETRTSWVVASVSLILLGLSFGGPWITAVGLKEIAADTGGARQVPSLAVSLAFFGTGVGGILMGRLANRYGVRWTVIFGTVMIALGLVLSRSARRGSSISATACSWAAGQCRPQRAAVRLCQPLVRPPPRLRARADLERRLSRGLHLADHLRALDRILRLALDHDRLCRAAARRHRAARHCLPAPAARAASVNRPAIAKGQTREGVRLERQCRVRHAGAGGVPVLRHHVDAAAASGRVLQRSRHFDNPRRHHAVGAARHGILQPAGLGLAVGPPGRPARPRCSAR